MEDGQASESKPVRPWREVAEQLSQEKDSVRILSLSEELMRALDQETKVNRKSA